MMPKKIFLMRPFVGEEELIAVKQVFDSKYLTEGPVTQEFESKFSQFVNAKHGIAVTSCMTGLELALKVLEIKPGDEVIVPDFTHPATGDCVCLAGADPVLVDVDRTTYNIQLAAVEDAITEKTKCIIPVSWGGNPLDPKIFKIGKDHGIPILEDAACSAGADINGKKVGSLAELTCFSFHPRKILTTGEGGMVTTNDSGLAEKAVALKHFGQTKNGRFTYHGTNYKMSNIVAAIGLEQLKKLPGILHDRINKAMIYTELLVNVRNIKTPEVRKGMRHVFQSYCIYIEKDSLRDRLRQDLATKGIETQIGTYALHLEPSYSDVKRIGNLHNSELLFKNLLTLPLHHELSQEDQEYVVNSIKSLMNGYGGIT
jgi:dTDP-4-amino-4,6-dideoxygalactose transaminase